MERDSQATRDDMGTEPGRDITPSKQAAEEESKNGWPLSNADERRLKTNALSAFIGVYQRPKILVSGLFHHPALTTLRSDRTTKGKDYTDTKMNPCGYPGCRTSAKETHYEKNQILASPHNH